MLGFKKVLAIGYCVATVLILTGFWPDNFSKPEAQVKIATVTETPEWHVATEIVSCTSGNADTPYSSELSDPVFKSAPVCDDLGGHIDRVDSVARQITFLAKWSNVTSMDDDRVNSALKRVGVLNNEREALYTHLDNCVVGDKITADEHTFISTMWIAPTWRSLSQAYSDLDEAVKNRALNIKR